jgi:hypothetical protein
VDSRREALAAAAVEAVTKKAASIAAVAAVATTGIINLQRYKVFVHKSFL